VPAPPADNTPEDALDAGSDAGVDASIPDEDGPLNMAPVTFGTNIKVSDDAGRAQQTEVLMAARAEDGLLFVGWVDNRQRPSRCAYSISKDGGLTWGANFFAATQGSAARSRVILRSRSTTPATCMRVARTMRAEAWARTTSCSRTPKTTARHGLTSSASINRSTSHGSAARATASCS
jgi:hypothetical protein